VPGRPRRALQLLQLAQALLRRERPAAHGRRLLQAACAPPSRPAVRSRGQRPEPVTARTERLGSGSTWAAPGPHAGRRLAARRAVLLRRRSAVRLRSRCARVLAPLEPGRRPALAPERRGARREQRRWTHRVRCAQEPELGRVARRVTQRRPSAGMRLYNVMSPSAGPARQAVGPQCPSSATWASWVPRAAQSAARSCSVPPSSRTARRERGRRSAARPAGHRAHRGRALAHSFALADRCACFRCSGLAWCLP